MICNHCDNWNKKMLNFYSNENFCYVSNKTLIISPLQIKVQFFNFVFISEEPIDKMFYSTLCVYLMLYNTMSFIFKTFMIYRLDVINFHLHCPILVYVQSLLYLINAHWSQCNLKIFGKVQAVNRLYYSMICSLGSSFFS